MSQHTPGQMELTEEAKAIIERESPYRNLSESSNTRYNAMEWALTNPELLKAQGLYTEEDWRIGHDWAKRTEQQELATLRQKLKLAEEALNTILANSTDIHVVELSARTALAQMEKI